MILAPPPLDPLKGILFPSGDRKSGEGFLPRPLIRENSFSRVFRNWFGFCRVWRSKDAVNDLQNNVDNPLSRIYSVKTMTALYIGPFGLRYDSRFVFIDNSKERKRGSKGFQNLPKRVFFVLL